MIHASFSVIMSVYQANDADQFFDAVHSVFNQSIMPAELIIVVDGPVGNELVTTILDVEKLPNVKILRLESNLGPGVSRDYAIKACRQSIVAIMDADDLCAFNRFELQLLELTNTGVDVVGGYIEEFNIVPGDSRRIRRVPIRHHEIIKLGHWRQPMNHVTIMFRINVYFKVGGYHPFRFAEDYDLFHRMFISGVIFSNIPVVLVYVRFGTAGLTRRRGMNCLRAELELLSRMRLSGFLSIPQWIVSSSIRVAVRFMPTSVLGLLYKYFLRQ